jgi:gamma-tubulin complex component 5
MLDVFDLTLRLEDARRLEAERDAEETQELSRLSFVCSSPSSPEKYVEAGEEEDATFLEGQDQSVLARDADREYRDVLDEVRAEFESHLRFVASGLRGVARASNDEAARKWDTLAEMLEAGTADVWA